VVNPKKHSRWLLRNMWETITGAWWPWVSHKRWLRFLRSEIKIRS
jgi:hypothetical protein